MPKDLALASKGIAFVEKWLGKRNPIVANTRIVVIVGVAVIGVLMALYLPLRAFFFEIVFVAVLVAILAALTVVVVEAYRGSPVAKRRALLALVLFLFLVSFGFLMAGDVTILGIKRSASFGVNYVLLLLRGRDGLDEFVVKASGDGARGEINSSEQLSRFVRPIPESGRSLELIGMSDNSVVDKPRFLRELTRNQVISMSGSVKAEASGKNVILLAAQTIRLAPGTDIQIGENDLIVVASQFEANGASIRAFAREATFHTGWRSSEVRRERCV